MMGYRQRVRPDGPAPPILRPRRDMIRYRNSLSEMHRNSDCAELILLVSIRFILMSELLPKPRKFWRRHRAAPNPWRSAAAGTGRRVALAN